MDLIGNVVHRFASELFEVRYARIFNAMSLEDAYKTLGLEPGASKDEIEKAYRRKAIENHPDRGGDLERMVEVNVAKDILEGKARPSSGGGSAGRAPGAWRPEPSPRPEPRKPPEVVDTFTGEPFASAIGDLRTPVEIKFISKEGYDSVKIPDNPDGASMSFAFWVIYGQTQTHHVFACLRNRNPNWYYSASKGGKVIVEESWESVIDKIPLSKKLTPSLVTANIKKVVGGWGDGLKPMRQLKYVAWPGGVPVEATFKKFRGSGGAPLKDILTDLGLVDASVGKGRKTNIEMYYKRNREKAKRNMELLKRMGPGAKMSWLLNYDWFLRVNGTEYQLNEKTVDKLVQGYLLNELMNRGGGWGEGQTKNLSKLRGSRWGIGPVDVVKKLLEAFEEEPSGLVVAFQKAVEDWSAEKTASIPELAAERSSLGLEVAMLPLKIARKVLADLHPPLGLPGGSCQVVRRVEENVHNPKLQQNLLRGLENGMPLSNQEASKVYRVDQEQGVGPIRTIEISSHSQYRMDFRSITVDDVRRALASFLKQMADWKALKNPAYERMGRELENHSEISWVDPRSKLKVVFRSSGNGKVLLISTYWKNRRDPPPCGE